MKSISAENKSSEPAAAFAVRSIKSFSSALFNISAVLDADAKMDVSIKEEDTLSVAAHPLNGCGDCKLFIADSGRKFFWPLSALLELFAK